ncbi:hypothetical protein CHS0354_017851 [Potamilus streckersoni]|uniref:DUF4773 domain-containing protein n=1 Tax=Potamilus streckersoni TaxID=2493646 RepID=A0AAE0T7F8_9BIVA|nr:hypothetical protein CHS0354_017851 [Potamilus streckersoni]
MGFRLLYRRKGLLILFFTVSLFWVIYLLFSVPESIDKFSDEVMSVRVNGKFGIQDDGLSRKYFSIPNRPIEDIVQPQSQEGDSESGNNPPGAVPEHQNVGPQPPVQGQPDWKELDSKSDKYVNQERKKIVLDQNEQPKLQQTSKYQNRQVQVDKIQGGNIKTADQKIQVAGSVGGEVLSATTDALQQESNSLGKGSVDLLVKNYQNNMKNMNQSSTSVSLANQTKQQLGESGIIKVLQLGEKVKNKTLEVGAKFKNKTLEKLSEIGVLPKKEYVKYIYEPIQWSLNLSVEDIGNIMKNTQFLNVQQKIDLSRYLPLEPIGPFNRSDTSDLFNRSNISYNKTEKYGMGFCSCTDWTCICCVRIVNEEMKISRAACSSFTYLSKSQELDFQFTLDKKPVFKKMLSAEHPPRICLGSVVKVVDLCVDFLNVTSRVTREEDHKFQLQGCTDFSLMLFNKTVSNFPVGCFHIPNPSSGQKVLKPDLGNWMP